MSAWGVAALVYAMVGVFIAMILHAFAKVKKIRCPWLVYFYVPAIWLPMGVWAVGAVIGERLAKEIE